MAGSSRRNSADRTPLPIRVYRYVRVGLHVFQGIATTAFVFPMIGLPRRQALIRRWSERLLGIMRVEARVQGLPPGGLPGAPKLPPTFPGAPRGLPGLPKGPLPGLGGFSGLGKKK